MPDEDATRGEQPQASQTEDESTQPPLTPEKQKHLEKLIEHILDKQLIPIIGDTVRNEQIFDINLDRRLSVGIAGQRAMNITEHLTALWAEEVKYPMIDRYRIGRVAQYHSILTDPLEAKKDYLKFQKRRLLQEARAMAGSGENRKRLLAQLDYWDNQRDRDLPSFAQIVEDLSFPYFPDGRQDPLDILARLPISIYITTGYYDFLERALLHRDKRPRTRLCPWTRAPIRLEGKHKPDPGYVPTPDEPLVFHLFGLEQYPESLVLSEDDYLQFLIELVRDEVRDASIQSIPIFLAEAMQASSLLLLGYRLHDWDFRVLFRVLQINAEMTKRIRKGVAIQLEPEPPPQIKDPEEAGKRARCYLTRTLLSPQIKDPEEARRRARCYLKDYFEQADLSVDWDYWDDFVATLWREYERQVTGG